MIKPIVSPFQRVLIRKGLCVGCTQPLKKSDELGKLSETKTVVECKCKRRYVYDKETASYKRATFEEEQLFLNKKAEIK